MFAASIFYTVGIWVATPSVSSGIKEWILGIGLVIEVSVFGFFCFKNVKETPDERFYANLAKAASLMFVFYTRRTDNPSSYHWVYGVSHSLHGPDLY